MMKNAIQLLCAITMLSVVVSASAAQSAAAAAPQKSDITTKAAAAPATPAVQQPPATAAAADQKAPNATADACHGTFPEGGAPEYLRPETAKQRQDRLGTADDPGCDPDSKKVFWRFGKGYTIDKYRRDWAVYETQEQGWIRPFGFVNSYRELYQQNPQYVWVWQPIPEEGKPVEEDTTTSTKSGRKFTDAEIAYLQYLRPEFTPLKVAPSTKTIRFEESSDGLPTNGSWRNELAVADMNGDGFLDIIAPPQRAGGTTPAIFLGDGAGHWKYWEQAKWPRSLDYGGVAAADFNRDGKMDLAFAIHLQNVKVFLGDGKGGFTESSEGLPKNFGSRRIAVADVNGDGWPDLIGIAEGPTAARAVDQGGDNRLTAFINKKGKSWEPVEIAPPGARVGGDWLAIGNFNGDKIPDFTTANIYMGGIHTIYLSSAPRTWVVGDPQSGQLVPTLSFYMAVAAGKFSSKKLDDAIVSYVRFWPTDVNPKLIPTPPTTEISGIDRISFSGKKPTRTPIVRWPTKFGVSGMAVGDFDGDGNLDVIYTNATQADKREITILLGDGKGGFKQAKIEGLQVAPQVTYDIKVADVNGDGRPDVILAYESDETTAFASRSGSIHVFLNRGVVAQKASQ